MVQHKTIPNLLASVYGLCPAVDRKLHYACYCQWKNVRSSC